MPASRTAVRLVSAFLLVLALVLPARATGRDALANEAIGTWYRLVLELVRHTPTYSPPVASRSLAYLGIAAYETLAAGDASAVSLAGQLNGFAPPPSRTAGEAHDAAVAVQAALAHAARTLFANTGPTGQRALAAVERKLSAKVAADVAPDVVERSAAHGRAVADHILAWSAGDGGATVENMGFPVSYSVSTEPGRWVPTSTIGQQQAPLLPRWGENRPLAMPDGKACPLPPPPPYSEAEGSAFHDEAMEVRSAVLAATPEQKAIARFWSDDPMLSPTPPGHWVSILMQVFDEAGDATPLVRADALARLGIALSDSFVACWQAKFQYDLIRPVTYIRKVIDPAWEPLLNTPPFPEYPSGHSTQSGAAAGVLTALFGADHAFEDRTHADDGLPGRRFASFRAAAEEAGISRLYGGIHFRAAIERGLTQGDCVADHVNRLRTIAQ